MLLEIRMEREIKELERAAKNLKFELLRQGFYHSDELWFFLFVERMTKFISAMAGTAVVGMAYASFPILAVILGAAITVLQTIGLVFGISSRAVLHENKRQHYFSLLAELESQPISEELIFRLNREMVRTWGSEPSTKWGVEVMARNSAMSSMKTKLEKGDLIPITPWEKCIRFVWRFSPEHFRLQENRT
jgi:hypothetical protein